VPGSLLGEDVTSRTMAELDRLSAALAVPSVAPRRWFLEDPAGPNLAGYLSRQPSGRSAAFYRSIDCRIDGTDNRDKHGRHGNLCPFGRATPRLWALSLARFRRSKPLRMAKRCPFANGLERRATQRLRSGPAGEPDLSDKFRSNPMMRDPIG
jgi:hypothetical protein